MRDMIFIIAIVLFVIAGYFQMDKIGRFIRKNQRISAVEDIKTTYNIIIATHSNDIIKILDKKISGMGGTTGFIIRKMSKTTILKKLIGNRIEIGIFENMPAQQRGIACKPLMLYGKNMYMVYNKNKFNAHTARAVAIVENSQFSQ